MVSGNLSIKYGYKGPNHACVTACSTGTHAIGDAANIIARGDAEVMVAGGAESAVNCLALAGFARMHAITADYNEEPEKLVLNYKKKIEFYQYTEILYY